MTVPSAGGNSRGPGSSAQRRMLRHRFSFGLGVSCVGSFLAVALFFVWMGNISIRENVWSVAIYEGETPFHLSPSSRHNSPVLTASDVSDVPAMFVADPFMVEDAGVWFMFVEVFNKKTGQGDIGLATSGDGGVAWTYQRIVLDEPFHLSYPSVFRWNGEWFMVPETQQAGEVRIYRASVFPTTWQYEATLLEGDQLADPTVFRHEGWWWMFVGRSHTHDRLRLFMSDNLLGGWTEHVDSPVVDSDANIARPGGPVLWHQGALYRLGQDCSPKYGNQLRAFRITTLTPTAYAEDPASASIVLTAGDGGWNANGMHHSDPHLIQDGRWIAAVDGHRKVWFVKRQ